MDYVLVDNHGSPRLDEREPALALNAAEITRPSAALSTGDFFGESDAREQACMHSVLVE